MGMELDMYDEFVQYYSINLLYGYGTLTIRHNDGPVDKYQSPIRVWNSMKSTSISKVTIVSISYMGMELGSCRSDFGWIVLYQSPIWVWNLSI